MKTLRNLFGLASTAASPQKSTDPPLRRQSVRYRSDSIVILGWWDGDEFRSTEGALLDVSQGGAAVAISGASVPQDGPAHLRLSEDEGDDWIDVDVRATRRMKASTAIAHLQFRGGCSYGFFRDALPQTTLDGEGPSYVSSEFDTRDWR